MKFTSFEYSSLPKPTVAATGPKNTAAATATTGVPRTTTTTMAATTTTTTPPLFGREEDDDDCSKSLSKSNAAMTAPKNTTAATTTTITATPHQRTTLFGVEEDDDGDFAKSLSTPTAVTTASTNTPQPHRAAKSTGAIRQHTPNEKIDLPTQLNPGPSDHTQRPQPNKASSSSDANYAPITSSKTHPGKRNQPNHHPTPITTLLERSTPKTKQINEKSTKEIVSNITSEMQPHSRAQQSPPRTQLTSIQTPHLQRSRATESSECGINTEKTRQKCSDSQKCSDIEILKNRTKGIPPTTPYTKPNSPLPASSTVLQKYSVDTTCSTQRNKRKFLNRTHSHSTYKDTGAHSTSTNRATNSTEHQVNSTYVENNSSEIQKQRANTRNIRNPEERKYKAHESSNYIRPSKPTHSTVPKTPRQVEYLTVNDKHPPTPTPANRPTHIITSKLSPKKGKQKE